LIASTAATASSIVEKANRPSPVGNTLEKPVSWLITGLPAAR
jgi:hypothetical protein